MSAAVEQVRLAGPPLQLLDLTIPDVVDEAQGTVAAVLDGRRLPYEELRERSVAVARGLVELGVRPGDRVGLIMTNTLEFPILFAGASRTGAIVVPLNTRLSPSELKVQLAHSGTSIVIAEEEFRGRDFRKEISALQDELPALRYVLPANASREIETLGTGQSLPEVCCQDPAVLIYTSGTTGSPKGCLHAHHSIVNNARMNTVLKRMTAEDRVIATLPFCNVGGIVNCLLEAFLVGATVVVQATFDPAEALSLIERERVTILLGTPTMYIRLLEHPSFSATDLSSLRAGTMGGAPCPPELVARWHQLDCEVVTIYGLSEAPSILANGKPSPGLEVGLTESEQLTARGYNLMLGYYLDPERTRERIRNGWLLTGDLAELNERGEIRIKGRVDEMVIVGGFNVHPSEVEDVLRGHPAVADAAVFGIPDHELGEVIAAWMIARDKAEIDPAELRVFCRQRLASFKIPHVFKVVEEFPLTANAKVQRYRMREVTVAATQGCELSAS